MASLYTEKSPFFLILSIILLFAPCRADPAPLQDFCVANLNSNVLVNGFTCKPPSSVSSNDFFFAGLAKEGSTANPFGVNVTAGNVLSFPALNTLGVSMNRVDFAPGGVNPPHSHPRATEMDIVIQGKLLIGFVTTGNVFFSKVVEAGEAFVIPQGLVHFQYNVGKGKALSITAFNSQLPGAVVIPPTLFASNPTIPSYILAKALQVDEEVVNEIKSKFGA